MDAQQKKQTAYVIAALLVLLLVLIVLAVRVGRYEDYLTGFWEADSTWAKEAGVDSAYLSFSAPTSSRYAWTTVRPGYLVMVRGGETVYNGPIGLTYRRGWLSAARSPTATYRIRTTVAEEAGGHDELAPISGQTLPEQLTLTISMSDGSLALHDNEATWGFYYKNFEASAFVATALRAA